MYTRWKIFVYQETFVKNVIKWMTAYCHAYPIESKYTGIADSIVNKYIYETLEGEIQCNQYLVINLT